MELHMFSEGSPFPNVANYPKGKIANWCDFNNGNKTFFIGLPNITDKEVRVFKNGEMLVGMYKQSKIVVLTGQIYTKGSKRNTLIGFESTYHPNINNEGEKQDYFSELYSLENTSESKIEIDFVLFDTSTNIIKGLRTIQCDNNFSKKAMKMLVEINEQDLTLAEYQEMTNKVHQYAPEQVFQFTTNRLRVEER